ncbi:inositol hexakisphosphate and diphosphoinositol-pentakisphosphate kinase [Malassezia cuniculi]|uniref:Inositol hexakisphosphate and diphosphoinositol-pentakisphosphate kinase n=1 Tax=Malassezia cuniculi TaxID=948313 RepID=A0AAF0ESH7_9BASI|nr:inositol hexakisphosphate and diphosphoinositol-pentakisphosphate kinase [Malassezia cuniculi]
MDHPIRLGVAAMDRKARSKPMQNILNRIQSTGRFEIITFGDKLILDEGWPIVDVLISFFSTGFPLEKAIRYVEIRRPLCVNDLSMQTVLWDRRTVLGMLAAAGIPTPYSITASRDGGPSLAPDVVEDIKQRLGVDFSERVPESVVKMKGPDCIVIDGREFPKSFVEKPVSGEDHNVHIYFSTERGGGGRRLFRKVGNKSSEFDANMVEPRLDGSYIYEEFMDVDNAEDIKVYTIGPDFAHAETRKSPVVDGLVKRNPDGKEIRYVTQLSAEEREIARKICLAFKQYICGFDLLRVRDKSYVIDVNGWSFVKGNDHYYGASSANLISFCVDNVVPRPMRRVSHSCAPMGTSSWVLKTNITVFRHGDRTPKQKLKRSFKHDEPWAAPLFALLHGHTDEIILRQNLELVTAALDEAIALPGANTADLGIVREIIERKKGFPGTKIQMKPSFAKDTGELVKMQLVVKWGGEFSHAALHQAKDYGTNMRRDMLLMNKEALNNCTVYTSSERRVSASAEIFAAAFLDDGANGKPREMVVRKDLLDDSNAAKDLMDVVKKELKAMLRPDAPDADKRPEGWPADLPPPALMGDAIKEILLSLRETMRRNYENLDVDSIQTRWCTHETPALFRERWEKLIEDFDEKANEPSRASELADMLSHDGLHNRVFIERIMSDDDEQPHLARLHRLYRMSLALFGFVCPREYGISPEEKEQIGVLTSLPLLNHIVDNLTASATEKGRCVLYFTKESHVHTLLNLIMASDLSVVMPTLPPLDYFSSITFEVYERESDAPGAENGAPERSLVISVSEGAHSSEILFINLDARHALTPLPSRPLTTHMDFDDVLRRLSAHREKRRDTNTARGQIEGSAVYFGEEDVDQQTVPISGQIDEE